MGAESGAHGDVGAVFFLQGLPAGHLSSGCDISVFFENNQNEARPTLTHGDPTLTEFHVQRESSISPRLCAA